MEQEGGGRGAAGGDGGDMNQQPPQDRKPKVVMQQGDEEARSQVQVLPQGQSQGQVQAPQLPQQPVQCPRCDSLNTKFCYYNNYSLSQPRYFCKTCRRYWTQGGTLRNVPVGGGCRKGKRAKNNSSSSSSSSVENSSSRISQQPQPPTHHEVALQAQPNLMVGARDPSSALASPPLGVPSVVPFFQGVGSGGYLSSLGGIHHSLNPSHPFDHQPLNVGGGDVVGVGGSNLGVLSGFNVPSLGSQRQIRTSQFYQLGSAEQGLIQSTMANSGAASHRDWTHSFISNAGNHRALDGSLWSTVSTTSISGNSQRNASAGSSSALMPNQWPNVPGFGPPPSSF